MFTASAKADYPPEVVDVNMNPIINQSEIYSGIYARVNVNFFPYSFGGKKGNWMWPGSGHEIGRRRIPGRKCADSGTGVWCNAPASQSNTTVQERTAECTGNQSDHRDADVIKRGFSPSF